MATTRASTAEAIRNAFLESGFVCSDEAATALHLSEVLGRPLLLEGPPGVGKTEIAKLWASFHSAELVRLQCYEGLDEAKALYEWSYGKQMLYAQLLRDKSAELLRAASSLSDAVVLLRGEADAFFSRDFLLPRPLLQAIVAKGPVVLLVDEVDRSDEEFEAFLLEVLSDYQVSIPELGTIVARQRPRVILTSNDSRELSDALRRRCLYHYIEYPSLDDEIRIVESRVPGVSVALTEKLVRFAQSLRKADLRKAPGIAEVVDWALALTAVGADSLSAAALRKTLGALLKNHEDVERVLADPARFPVIPAVARFAHALRGEGIAASPAELLDASRAVQAVGLEDRERFRAALRATLAKTREARRAFDRAFDAFFVTPQPLPGTGKGQRPGAGAGGQRRSDRGEGSMAPRRPTSEPRDDARSRRRGVHEDREAVKRALESVRHRVERRDGRLRGAPARRVTQADRAGREASARAAKPAAARPDDPLHRNLAQAITVDDERALAREVPRLIEAIRLREARRMRIARRGRLALRDAFRRNVGHGGVPFELPYRRPRRRPSRVVLLVDVSWSVARAAGLFLWMSAAFLALGRRSRIVAFVDRPVDATSAIARWGRSRQDADGNAGSPSRPRHARPGDGIARAGLSFADVLSGLRGLSLDAASDYGRALHGLLTSRLAPAGRDTVLVVLGDARTNRFDPLPWVMAEIARRCRVVIWLVPEPESRWGTADSALASYLPAIDLVAEATDLAGLARGVAATLKRL